MYDVIIKVSLVAIGKVELVKKLRKWSFSLVLTTRNIFTPAVYCKQNLFEGALGGSG